MTVLAVRQSTAEASWDWIDTALLGGLLFLGLYFPTSLQGEFSKFLLGANYLASFMLLAFLAARHGIAGFAVSVTCLSIVPALLVFTITSHLNFYSPGALAAYAVLSLLLIVNIRDLVFPDSLFRVFVLVNVLNIAAAGAIVSGFEPLNQFLVNNYSAFYPELVQYMLDVRKPVLTFASHSVAGFFLYLFFFAALQTWRLKGKRLFLFFAYCYVIAMFALLSVTGLALGFVAFFQLSFYLWAKKHWLILATTVLVSLGLPLGFRLVVQIPVTSNEVLEATNSTLTSSENGLSGRFGPGGTLSYDVSYLNEHPFSPVGVSYTDRLFFGDSGPIEYLIRGSLPLLLIVYGGLFLFLRRNLFATSDAYLIFGVTLAFEAGYTVLGNFRTFYLIPFFVAYLNGLRRVENRSA